MGGSLRKVAESSQMHHLEINAARVLQRGPWALLALTHSKKLWQRSHADGHDLVSDSYLKPSTDMLQSDRQILYRLEFSFDWAKVRFQWSLRGLQDLSGARSCYFSCRFRIALAPV